MRPRWYKAKVNMRFFKGECYVAETENRDQVKILVSTTKDGADARYILISKDEFNSRLADKTIGNSVRLELKQHLATEALFKKAKDYTKNVDATGLGYETEKFQAQNRITRPQPETPAEINVIHFDLSKAADWSVGEAEQQLGRTKPRQAALLSKPQSK
jgi:hypothetical protein